MLPELWFEPMLLSFPSAPLGRGANLDRKKRVSEYLGGCTRTYIGFIICDWKGHKGQCYLTDFLVGLANSWGLKEVYAHLVQKLPVLHLLYINNLQCYQGFALTPQISNFTVCAFIDLPTSMYLVGAVGLCNRRLTGSKYPLLIPSSRFGTWIVYLSRPLLLCNPRD